VSEWKPIETAPRDGTEILLFCPGLGSWQRVLSGEVVVGAWKEHLFSQGWYSDSSSSMDGGYESTGDYIVHDPVVATHWMPLPEPPR
jgi:hypothetical protein